ncbi:hypothetical protein QQ991_15000 [Weizmannia coagulans]|jgi:hypothetical protein|uniref:Uncharacterized protein n=4 Tax=Heyndrickxia TaxID=2837504 RepID=A0A0C5C4Z1_HEYCO|nr:MULTISPECIES: hypothetical protein [Heyndrickxia]AJO21866.1 hypothetical protein SB48_HM08orf01642 [Heyndrickxia coagulans]AKN52515.1 hypothetical protein AB434_0110 [Heyndrickxia coagulans]ATW82328.1 hypothetical protein CIW84_04650 [Heyndrickxia coagulans]AVD57013.1 hypothetical protein C3766_13310 [Heyndrickxia coagulans]AWP37953.1 hypothetical protein CYJ15_13660 [Heyndrickxia coagulans]
MEWTIDDRIYDTFWEAEEVGFSSVSDMGEGRGFITPDLKVASVLSYALCGLPDVTYLVHTEEFLEDGILKYKIWVENL